MPTKSQHQASEFAIIAAFVNCKFALTHPLHDSISFSSLSEGLCWQAKAHAESGTKCSQGL